MAIDMTRYNAKFDSIVTKMQALGSDIESTPKTLVAIDNGLDSISNGGEPISVSEKDINFYDYDGVLVASYWLSDLPLDALPTPPNHSNDDVPLTFQEWNWTLTSINSRTQFLNVGANYRTTDNNWHLILEFPLNILKSYNVDFRIKSSSGGTIYWGDGSNSSFGTGASTLTHTYTLGGKYHCYFDAVNIFFENYGLNGGISTYNNTFIKKIFLPSSAVILSQQGMFSTCAGLKNINIPSTSYATTGSAFSGCNNLLFIVISRNWSNTYSSAFRYCYALEKIVYSQNNANYLNSGSQYRDCLNLKNVIISASIIGIGNFTFNNCPLLEFVKLESSSPPTLSNINAFGGNHPQRKFYIPSGSLSTYESATNWSSFSGNFIEY